MRLTALATLLALVGAGSASAAQFVVCDNGVRCFRAPCPSRNAVDLQARKVVRGVAFDFAQVPLADRQDEKGAFRSGLYYGTGVVEGELRERPQKSPLLTITGYVRQSTDAERRLCRPSARPPT